jgi:hypothetical protein
MGIIYQKDRRVGITYAYQNESSWDKEKKQPRSRRKLSGRLDEETGEIVSTREYKKKNIAVEEVVLKPGPVPITKIRRSFYGATYLLDQIGDLTGVEADLKACFPNTYKKLLSIAYFLVLEENNSLSRFSHWQRLHNHLE